MTPFFKFPSTRWLLLALIAGLSIAAAPLARSTPPDVRDFSLLPTGDFAGGDGIIVWTGPAPKTFGELQIGAPPSGIADSPPAALIFVSNATPAANNCPTLTFKTPHLAVEGTNKTASCSIRFLVPITTDYKADIFFGGNWNRDAAVLMLRKGVVYLSARALLQIGNYEPNTWQELRVDYDLAKKTFSVFVNGKEKAFDLPWNHPNPDDTLMIAADTLPAPQPNIPVLYIQKITASSESP